MIDLTTAVEVVCGVVTAASAICAMTPTPDPKTPLGKVYHVIEVAGLLVGKAKQTGMVPDNKVVDAIEADVVAGASQVMGSKTSPPAS